MSRADVRTAVQSFFAPVNGVPTVTLLNTVYKTVPKVANGQDWMPSLNNGSGAVAAVFIERENEHRIAMGGATSGWKRTAYDVGLIVRYRSLKASADDAMNDYDTLIEGIKTKLRSDHALAHGVTIFSAGEEDLGITISSDMPVLVNGETHIWSVVQFTVVQMVQA